MIKIEYKEKLEDELLDLIDDEFNTYAIKNNVKCNYTPFNFVAKDNEKVIGILTGHTYYEEVHIADIIVKEEYRSKGVGTSLLKMVEEYFTGKEFENINLTTYAFQAPLFYEKCGFTLEYVRKNLRNDKLSKYFFIKYFKN